MKRVVAGTLDVAYLEQGATSGELVVLLHDFPYDVHGYSAVAERLVSSGRRVITPWLRGYRPTSFLRLETPRTGQQAALGADLLALLDALLLPILPPARELLGDRGYDSTWFRAALAGRGITPCIPSTRSRKQPLAYNRTLYRLRHRIETMFARLKDWRRIATNYGRCAHTFFSAICIAATVTYWL